MYSSGSQFSSASSRGSPLLSGIVSLVTHLLIFWSSLSGLRPALVADLSAPHPRGTLWCRVLALPPDRKGLSRLRVPLFWNGLPSDLRSLSRDLSSSFYKLLKTLLFGRAWAGSASE